MLTRLSERSNEPISPARLAASTRASLLLWGGFQEVLDSAEKLVG